MLVLPRRAASRALISFPRPPCWCWCCSLSFAAAALPGLVQEVPGPQGRGKEWRREQQGPIVSKKAFPGVIQATPNVLRFPHGKWIPSSSVLNMITLQKRTETTSNQETCSSPRSQELDGLSVFTIPSQQMLDFHNAKDTVESTMRNTCPLSSQ